MTWRLAAALGALVLLALGIDVVFSDGDERGSIAVVGPSNLDENGEIIERRVDLIASVARFEPGDGWSIGADGRTIGFMDAVLDENRTMRIAPGTPGESSCVDYTARNGCVVMADLVGEAVVWFTLLPAGPNETAQLPPIIELEDGYAVFESGLRVRYQRVIERDSLTCTEDKNITSFSDFLRRFGPDSVSIVDLATQQVARVLCGEESAPPSQDRYDGSLEARIVSPTTLDSLPTEPFPSGSVPTEAPPADPFSVDPVSSSPLSTDTRSTEP